MGQINILKSHAPANICAFPLDLDIRLEGPEDPHLRNSSFGGHVTALTLQYL